MSASRLRIRFIFPAVHGILLVVSQYGFLVEFHPKALSEPDVPRRIKHGTSTEDFVRALTSQASSLKPYTTLQA